MRSRQTDIAASTCAGSSCTSDGTGSGAFTTTSWEPSAGRDENSSGSPRPAAASGSSPPPLPSSASLESAGYRFGTTRTSQPGESGGPPPGRSA